YKLYTKINLLASLIPCKSKKISKRKQWKPTLEEIRSSILIRIETSQDIEGVIASTTERNEKNASATQPYLIVEIRDIEVKRVYVVINEIIYKVPTLSKGIDLCFKVYMVLVLKFPPENEHVWLFLQRAVYKIESQSDHIIPSILDLVNKCQLELKG
ncbi:hypothetical protein PPYR_02276, partial [Photinus pyralis]